MKYLFTVLLLLCVGVGRGQAPPIAQEPQLLTQELDKGVTGVILLGTFYLLKSIVDKLTAALENNTNALKDIEKVVSKIETTVHENSAQVEALRSDVDELLQKRRNE